MMTPEQIRLKQNPVLTNLLLGIRQSQFVAEILFPRLPQALRGITLAKIGDEAFKRYDLRRAPGSATKRVEVNYDGQTYTVNQYSVEVPIPRELIQENEAASRLNLIGRNLDISRIAMSTASAVLSLDYELEAATLATAPGSYPTGNVTALTGTAKWSAATGTPVDDIRNASEVIRAAVGVRPNTLLLGADVFNKLILNKQVLSMLPSTQLGPATLDQLKVVLGVPSIVVGEAVWRAGGKNTDVWGNNAILAYVPPSFGGGDVSLAEPVFALTNVLEGHPFAETPYYESNLKSWVYGATYERQCSVVYGESGFLFQTPV